MKTIGLARGLSRHVVNGSLIVLLVALTINTLFAVMGSPPKDLPSESFVPSPSTAAGVVSWQGLLRRNLFRPVAAAPAPAPVVVAPKPVEPPPPPPIPLTQRAAHWRLAGIMPGDGGYQAVMEDGRRGTSVYVSAGDRLDELKVEKVLSDRVVLAYEEETLELRL